MCDDKNGKSPKSDDENELSASDDSEPEEAPNNAPFDPELDGEDDEEDEDQGKAADKVALDDAAQKTSAFSLKGGSSGFSSRSHSIFDCLDNMAKMTSSSMGQDNVIDGLFARPVAPPPSRKTSHPPSATPPPAKKRGIPDYMVNPDRWTHYSLEDTAETSDQGNSRVAHQYLASLLQKKEEPIRNRDSFNTEEKIIFSKPNRVGREQPPSKLEKEGKEKGMRLSHLEDEEDEEEDKKGALKKRSKEDSADIEKTLEKEDDDDDDGTQEANSGFVAFKKTHHKMYRKSTAESSHT